LKEETSPKLKTRESRSQLGTTAKGPPSNSASPREREKKTRRFDVHGRDTAFSSGPPNAAQQSERGGAGSGAKRLERGGKRKEGRQNAFKRRANFYGKAIEHLGMEPHQKAQNEKRTQDK